MEVLNSNKNRVKIFEEGIQSDVRLPKFRNSENAKKTRRKRYKC